jgi:hypothetical protein
MFPVGRRGKEVSKIGEEGNEKREGTRRETRKGGEETKKEKEK